LSRVPPPRDWADGGSAMTKSSGGKVPIMLSSVTAIGC
jgi:hypothetical protein